jgi:hypothetical protein
VSATDWAGPTVSIQLVALVNTVDPALGPPAPVDGHLGLDVFDDLESEPD